MTMKKQSKSCLLFLSLLIIGVGVANAQNPTIDSLNKVLKSAKEDTNKVNVLNGLSLQFRQITDYDTAMLYAKNAIQLAKKLSFKNGIAMSYKAKGDVHYDKSIYPEAMEDYSIALKIFEETRNKEGLSDMYNNIGIIYQKIGNYPKALENYFSSLKIKETTDDKLGLAACYNNIGNIYSSQHNYSESLKYLSSALRVNKSIKNQKWIGYNYANIGNVYFALGNYSEALNNYYQLLEIGTDIGDQPSIAGAYLGIGDVHYNKGNYPEALKNYSTALKIFEFNKLKYGTAVTYCHIGKAYNKLNQPKEGKVWLKKALELSKEIDAKDNIQSSYESLTSADSTLGNYRGALENYKLYTIYKDSLFNEENTKKLTQSIMQYEFDKKQLADSLKSVQVKRLATAKLEKQKTYTYIGVGLTVLLLTFSGFMFRNNKNLSAEKQKSESLLLNILPEEVSKELKERGATTAQEYDHVTVLFTDFVNFTTAGERMTPKELIEELHNCFKAFDEIIDKYHIEKIKTVGDAYLAVSGLPQPDDDHAQHIVKASTEIRKFMQKRRAELGDKTFEVRIGVHSGSVVAGIVGVKKFAYDIWGDTVNTAARMEQSGEAGKVNISEATYELVKEDFECTYRGEIEAKNKGALKMYFVE